MVYSTQTPREKWQIACNEQHPHIFAHSTHTHPHTQREKHTRACTRTFRHTGACKYTSTRAHTHTHTHKHNTQSALGPGVGGPEADHPGHRHQRGGHQGHGGERPAGARAGRGSVSVEHSGPGARPSPSHPVVHGMGRALFRMGEMGRGESRQSQGLYDITSGVHLHCWYFLRKENHSKNCIIQRAPPPN